MLWLCFRFDRRRLSRVVIGLIPFFAVALVYLFYVEAQPWSSPISIPAVSQWGQLLWVMLVSGLLPSIVGTGVSSSALTTAVVLSDVLVAAGLALGALWLWTRRRLRWVSLAFFVVGLLLVSIPVAIERNAVPSASGITSRYLTFLPMLLAIAAAGAVRDCAGRCGRGPPPRSGYTISAERRGLSGSSSALDACSTSAICTPPTCAVPGLEAAG